MCFASTISKISLFPLFGSYRIRERARVMKFNFKNIILIHRGNALAHSPPWGLAKEVPFQLYVLQDHPQSVLPLWQWNNLTSARV